MQSVISPGESPLTVSLPFNATNTIIKLFSRCIVTEGYTLDIPKIRYQRLSVITLNKT